MKSLNSQLPLAADTIVVGGGTAGAVFAGLLAERHRDSVLLMESGPDYGAFNGALWPRDMLDSRRLPRSHDWHYSSGATRVPRVLEFPRARILGGCSSHNGCTAAIGARLDYDNWVAAGNPGWSAAELAPLFEMIRSRFRVRTFGLDELTAAQAQFVFAGQRLGLPLAFDLDTYEAGVGIGPMAANIVDGVRWNAAFAFLDPVRERRHLQIAGDVLVDRVIAENGRATGVQVIANGEIHTIRGQRIVLCAGAFGSPTILLRSGIGSASESRRLGVQVVSDLPGVGRNLLDHPCVRLDFAGTERFIQSMQGSRWSPDEQAVGRAKSPLCDVGPYDMHVFLSAGLQTDSSVPSISLYGGAMRAVSQGSLRLRDTNPSTLAIIDPCYVTDPEGHDLSVLRCAGELLREMSQVPDLARLLGAGLESSGQLADNVVSYCHPAGTCKMGPQIDRSAVVDAHCRVHGVEGLYVADASIIPTNIRANINLPTAMIAANAAQLLDR